MSFKTIVFYGSYRHERQGIKAACFMIEQLQQREHEVIFADAKEYGFEILARMYKDSVQDKTLQRLNRKGFHKNYHIL